MGVADGALVAHVVAFAWSEGKRGDNAESGEIANPGAPLGSVCRREVVKQAKPLAVGVVAAVVARANVNKFTERLSGFWTKPRFW